MQYVILCLQMLLYHKGERGQLADAQVCRITSLDGQEVASVGRVPGPRSGR
jgi:hypothetical protein